MFMRVGCTFGSLSTTETVDAAKPYPEIRFMGNGPTGAWQSVVDNDAHGYPALLNFSATCFFTALHLKLQVPVFRNVPIGLVTSSVPAQTIERFLPPVAMEAAGIPAANATGESCGQVAHELYDTMIVPVAPFTFKALIWYVKKVLYVQV